MGNPYAITIPLIANGNINTSSFVKGDPSNDEYCLQAGVGDTPIGISGSATDNAPGIPGATAYDAVQGEELTVFPAFSVVQLTAGAAGWTRFNFLKPDANGYGTPVTSINDIPGAMALESVNAGELSRVLVLPPTINRAAATVVSTAVSVSPAVTDSGKTYVVTAADKVVTLPTAAAGLYFRVIASGTGATGGSTGTTVAVQAGDLMHGDGFTAAAGKGAINTHATAADGNWIEVIGNGIDGWNILGVGGTWARVA